MQVGTQPPSPSEPPSLASVSGAAVPGFVGHNVVLAFDSSIVPSGSALTFWTGNAFQGYQSLGSAVIGNNPMVVTIPAASTISAGAGLTVTAGTSAGAFNVIGQFPPPVTPPP
jgi:hypothetical protein